MLVRQIFDPGLAQYAYLIGCQATGEALVIDPERDVDRYVEAAEAEGLTLTAVAETHIHADFLSGARELAERHGARVYVSAEGGADWQVEWAKDHPRATLLRHGDVFRVGRVEVKALHTPGHTPEHLAYLIVDRGAGAEDPIALVSGDFVFVGDLGRPDLLETAAGVQGARERSARALFRSLPRFLALEEHVQVWPGHGAGSACGKALGAVPVSTVGYERRHNAALAAAAGGEEAFVDAILTDQPEPPLYFARMKRENRAGPRLLGALPRPRRVGLGELAGLLDDPALVVLDTRASRAAFMDGHVPGSLHAPLGRRFPTIVGSLIEDQTRPILLVAEEEDVEEAVRALVRIGHDAFAGWVDPVTVERWLAGTGRGASIRRIDMAALAALRERPLHRALDVRSGAEYRSGHVPGALHVPHTRLPRLLDRIPAGATLLVYCASGARAAAASSWLAGRGYDVCWVDGEWSAWVDAGEPVERGGEAPAAAPAGRGS